MESQGWGEIGASVPDRRKVHQEPADLWLRKVVSNWRKVVFSAAKAQKPPDVWFHGFSSTDDYRWHPVRLRFPKGFSMDGGSQYQKAQLGSTLAMKNHQILKGHLGKSAVNSGFSIARRG